MAALYLHTITMKRETGESYFDQTYRITPFKKGMGDVIRYLITDPLLNITEGDQELCISPIPKECSVFVLLVNNIPGRYEVVKKIAQSLDIPLKEQGKKKSSKKKEDLWGDILLRHCERKDVFFQPIPIVDSDQLERLDNIDDVISMCLHPNYDVDSRMEYLFRVQLPRLLPTSASEMVDDMKYQPHAIVYTNPKTGKSTMAECCGCRIDRASVAKLMGFASADTTVKGTLDRETRPILLDEIQEEMNECIYGQLLTFMENGIARIEKGRASVITKGCCPIVFMGNPKGGDTGPKDPLYTHSTTEELVSKFYTMMTTLTDNQAALSSRIGIIYFDEGFKAATALKKQDVVDNRKARLLLRVIIEESSKLYTDFLRRRKIISWLETGHDKDYTDQLNAIAQAAREVRIKQTILGQYNNYRHMRGAAIRLVATEYIGHHLDEIKDDDILKSADSHYHILIHENVSSLEKLIAGLDESLVHDIKINQLANKTNNCSRMVILALWLADRNGMNLRGWVPIEELKAYMEELEPIVHKYASPRRVADYLKRRKNSSTASLRSFGVAALYLEDGIAFKCDYEVISGLFKAINNQECLFKGDTNDTKDNRNDSVDETRDEGGGLSSCRTINPPKRLVKKVSMVSPGIASKDTNDTTDSIKLEITDDNKGDDLPITNGILRLLRDHPKGLEERDIISHYPEKEALVEKMLKVLIDRAEIFEPRKNMFRVFI